MHMRLRRSLHSCGCASNLQLCSQTSQETHKPVKKCSGLHHLAPPSCQWCVGEMRFQTLPPTSGLTSGRAGRALNVVPSSRPPTHQPACARCLEALSGTWASPCLFLGGSATRTLAPRALSSAHRPYPQDCFTEETH